MSTFSRLLVLALLGALLGAGVYFGAPWLRTLPRLARLRAYLADPQAHPEWQLRAGERCGGAPFRQPTDGYLGFSYGDSWRPGQLHQGLDIFGPTELGQTPVMAAYPGYLTRLLDWKSTVILRVPRDPLEPARQIWVYYTHLADAEGNSYIAPEFPPGTRERYVEAGALLGHQGNYSGDSANPVGMHLHFSIVKDDGQGNFMNELRFENTLAPLPYLGLEPGTWPIVCPAEG